MYDELNLRAKEYLIKVFKRNYIKMYDNGKLVKRCFKEIDLLYNKKLLFIIEYLYKYKEENSNVSYHFRGMINNLLVLYVLGLTKVDPIEYNLPYELFNDKTINVDLINGSKLDLVCFLEKHTEYFKVISGSHELEDIEEINALLDNHYLLIPSINIPKDILLKYNDSGVLETIDDYGKYKDKYITIRIDEKPPITNTTKVCLDNILTNNFEKEIADILKPKTMNDYIKVKSISHGTDCWNFNQSKLVEKSKINFDNLLATREDVYEYLIEHKVDKKVVLEIIRILCKGCINKSKYGWDKYVKIMNDHNCDDIFIDILSKILFIFGRGQAVSECLFVLDENNYINKSN